MSQQLQALAPPAGIIPVVVPADVVLIHAPALAVWAGAITVFPVGFHFTLLALFDPGLGIQSVDLALDLHERGSRTWLEVGYADGRRRAADLNTNTPRRQPQGPHLYIQHGETNSQGWHRSIWWVTPLPPPGPVEIALHIGGAEILTATGYVDGALLSAAANGAEVCWAQGGPTIVI